MSRRRRVPRPRRQRPPLAAREYARAYRCPDCHSETDLIRDEHGIWHLTVYHDEWCPALNGIVDRGAAGRTASQAAANRIGAPALYLQEVTPGAWRTSTHRPREEPRTS